MPFRMVSVSASSTSSKINSDLLERQLGNRVELVGFSGLFFAEEPMADAASEFLTNVVIVHKDGNLPLP